MSIILKHISILSQYFNHDGRMKENELVLKVRVHKELCQTTKWSEFA